MPNFNLAPIEDDAAFEPVVPSTQAAQGGGGKPSAKPGRQMDRAQARAEFIRRSEQGPFKPAAQLFNALASPDTKIGIFTGPINAISKLGNAIGDAIQRKPIDTKDAWVIPTEVTRKLNPFRIVGGYGDQVLPADQAGLELGGAIGAEVLGAVTGTTLIRRLGQVSQLKRVADAARATQAMRSLAVVQRANGPLRTAVKVGQNVGEALVSTTMASPFLDQDGGNLADLGKAVGLNLPGQTNESDNYLTKLGKSVAVEGVLAPLSVIGAASIVPALRKAMFNRGSTLLDDLADAELAPYMPRVSDLPALPPGRQAPQLPSAQMQAVADGGPITPARVNAVTPGGALPGSAPGAPQLPPYQPGGAMVQVPRYGSAIERYLDDATQIRQVEEQRQRLLSAGLLKQGEAGQLELNITSGDEAARAQIEQLQRQRGQLVAELEQADEATRPELLKQVDEIDQQTADLNLSGSTEQFLAPRGSRQMELNLDTRPELDTVLAQLDELSDQEIRGLHSRVYREVGAERNAAELEATQQQIDQLNQRLTEINARQQTGELTPRGAKGLLTKAQRELGAAQAQLRTIQQRIDVPETTVGRQLEITLQQQLGLDLSQEIPLPPLPQITRAASEYGYRTPGDYRAALEGWPRDLLRRLAMPNSSPEVAAILKANTGRRVWQAKKSDIIDALVEQSLRLGRYLPPEAEQLQMQLRVNLAGQADAPLLDVPADLRTTSRMGQTLDADGNPVTVPMGEFQSRGMDSQTREQLKAEILRRMIDNGEVQAPVTPIPNRPSAPSFYQQGNFVDDLLADETGQLAMAFNNDALPPYKAGGKNADALIDEMRLRFEYNLLDAKAMQAQKDAFMAAHGWDRLSWEEKKRTGLLGRGVFQMSRGDLTSPVDVVRPATPQFTPELPVSGERAPQPYRGDGSAQADVQQFAPELKPKPDRKPAVYDTKTVMASINGEAMVVPKEQMPKPQAEPATGRGKRTAPTTADAKAAKQALADIKKEREAMAQQLEQLRKQHQGGTC